ncbi:MAG: hypothetical protein ABFD79_01455 [Phycisphaerales bacterium]
MITESIKLEKKRCKQKPIYRQIAEHMKHEIQSNSIKTSQCLSATLGLVRKRNVGYSTIVVAIKKLEKGGFVHPNEERAKGLLLFIHMKIMKFSFSLGCGNAQFIALEGR